MDPLSKNGNDDLAWDENEAFLRGVETRRAVVGDDYVEGSMERGARDGFTHDLQQLVNEFVWGSVWSRPGLALAERSLVVVTILAVRGQEDELKLHLRGALRNGVTPVQLREALLQIAAYAGMPACLLGFRAASAVLDELDIDTRELAPR